MAHGQFTHIDIPADDPVRAQRFYEGVCGWSFGSMPEFPDYYLFRTGDDEHAMGGGIGKRGQTAPDRIRNYIDVESIDSLLPKVRELGGSVLQPKAEVPGQGWYVVLTDSEGNEIALWEGLPH